MSSKALDQGGISTEGHRSAGGPRFVGRVSGGWARARQGGGLEVGAFVFGPVVSALLFVAPFVLVGVLGPISPHVSPHARGAPL